jgi:multiple sugar transport system substrate-binding protein
MFKTLKMMVTTVAATGALSTAPFAGDLVITYDDLNPNPKKAFDAVVEAFKAANPGINVVVNNNDREAHKSAIRNFLSANPPDVTSWYPGNRMGPFVDAGLFEPIDELWTENNLDQDMAAVQPTMTRNGKIWGVPYSYYQWGVYYRKDIYDKLGLSEPKTWNELLSNCDALKGVGVTPFTIGTKFLWTAAGVFDYLNLRTNGYDVHNALTAGEIKYTDDRIRATFANWKEMLDRCSFIDNHASLDWQGGVAAFAKGDAAMYVMGNFSVGAYREAGLKDDQIDFFQFPEITPGLPMAEEAPADAFFIPSGAKNKEDAKKFLAFIAQPDIQTQWNLTLGQLPPNSKAEVGDDKFIQEGFEVVSNAAGLAQFYDRDAPAAMASEGMKGFQEFMLDPSKLDAILVRLDSVQAEVYK